MKNLFIAIATIFSVSIAAQSLSPREKQLFDLLSKSPYSKNNTTEGKIYVAKKYACLEKHYDLNPLEQKEFLPIKELNEQYPQWNTMFDNTIENRSILQESLQPVHFSKSKKHDFFPKCLKKPY